MEPTFITWLLVVFGGITLLPLFFAQLTILIEPKGQRAKDILIAKGDDWRNDTHFRFACGAAIADWMVLMPLLIAGSIGVIMGTGWGYLLWACAGICSLYINVILFVMEKAYVYPSRGPWAYYTYYWGFFVIWGALAVVYSALRLCGIHV
jgi:hypothetical protein